MKSLLKIMLKSCFKFNLIYSQELGAVVEGVAPRHQVVVDVGISVAGLLVLLLSGRVTFRKAGSFCNKLVEVSCHVSCIGINPCYVASLSSWRPQGRQ